VRRSTDYADREGESSKVKGGPQITQIRQKKEVSRPVKQVQQTFHKAGRGAKAQRMKVRS
jgi:hypothetical protein